jgi:hypothetical protein
MQYTEAQRAVAVEIVERYGGSVTKEALWEVREALQSPDLPKVSVWRWLHAQVVTPVAAVTDIKKELPKSIEPPHYSITPVARAKASKSLDQMFEDVADKYLAHALKPEVIAEMKGQPAVMAAAIATDKMRLLRGLPTEIVSILPGLVASMQERGMNPTLVFQAMYDKLQLPDRVQE